MNFPKMLILNSTMNPPKNWLAIFQNNTNCQESCRRKIRFVHLRHVNLLSLHCYLDLCISVLKFMCCPIIQKGSRKRIPYTNIIIFLFFWKVKGSGLIFLKFRVKRSIIVSTFFIFLGSEGVHAMYGMLVLFLLYLV